MKGSFHGQHSMLILGIIFYMFGLVGVPSSYAQSPRIYTTDDGLPQNSVISTIDSQGLVWVGSADGLRVTDGEAFWYPLRDSVLYRGFIRALYHSKKTHHIIAALADKGYVIDKGKIIHTFPAPFISKYSEIDSVSFFGYSADVKPFNYLIDVTSPNVTALTISQATIYFFADEQYYWFFRSNGIYRSPKSFDEKDWNVISEHSFDQLGIIASENGKTYLIGNRIPHFIDVYEVHFSPFRIRKMLSSLSKYAHSYQNYPVEIKGTFAADGSIWFGSRHLKLQRLDTTTQRITPLSNASVLTMDKDDQGGIWIGTDPNGLYYYPPPVPKFEVLTDSNRVFKSLHFLDDNRLLALETLRDSSVFEWNLSKPGSRLTKRFHLEWERAPISLIPSEDGMMISTEFSHVYRLDNHFVVKEVVYNPRNDNIVQDRANRALLQAFLLENDTYWMQTLDGFATYQRKTLTWDFISLSDINPTYTIWRIKPSVVGDEVILGQNNHVVIVHRPTLQWKKIALSDPKLQANVRMTTPDSVHAWAKNIQWIATENGLYWVDRVRNTSGKVLFETPPPSTFMYGILQDKLGRLWISTNKGILCATPFPSGDQIRAYIRVYTKEDGLPASEFNSFSYAKSPSGKMAFGGMGGIVVFHPDDFPADTTAPKPFLKSVEVFEVARDLDASNHLVLSSDENRVTFHFTALDYDHPEATQFQVQLEGIDKTWVSRNHSKYMMYPTLPYGSYSFKARANGHNGVWSGAVTLAEITILPPPYLRWWAIVLELVVFGSLLVTVIRYFTTRKLQERIRLLETETRIQEEKLKTRSQIARDLHDDVSATISSIAMLSAQNDSQHQERGKRINDLVVQARTQMEELIWSLSPKNDTLDKLIYRIVDLLNDLLDGDRFEIEIQIPEQIPDFTLDFEKRKHIYLVIKEAMINTLKYADADRISFVVDVLKNSIAFTFSDNGIGFDVGEQHDAPFGGNGLPNMRDRAAALKSNLTITSKPGATSVRLEVPFSALELEV